LDIFTGGEKATCAWTAKGDAAKRKINIAMRLAECCGA
jgi:hypothetical protein